MCCHQNRPGVIGRPLADVTSRENEPIPRVVSQCINYLREFGVAEVGLFRISSDVAVNVELQTLVDETALFDIRTVLDKLHPDDASHAAANLLKVCLNRTTSRSDPIRSD
jgi:hypothetical protein